MHQPFQIGVLYLNSLVRMVCIAQALSTAIPIDTAAGMLKVRDNEVILIRSPPSFLECQSVFPTVNMSS